MQKKVEHKPTSKKQNKNKKKKTQKSQAFKQAPGMKKWENGLIIITWQSRWRKVMVHTLFWYQIMYQMQFMKRDLEANLPF